MIEALQGLADTANAVIQASWQTLQDWLWLELGVTTVVPLLFALACATGAYLIFSATSKGPR